MKPATSTKRKAKKPTAEDQRNYLAATAQTKQNADWPLSALGEDADVYLNQHALRCRMRDLYRTNPYFQKYREELWGNVFGEKGITLRMKVKETEDRVIHTPDEKWAHVLWHRRRLRVMEWAAQKTGQQLGIIGKQIQQRAEDFSKRGKAKIQVGESDVFANQLIERAQEDYKQAKYCDFRQRFDHLTIEQLSIVSAARDGDFFLRQVMDPAVNKYGYSLQLINSEFCDHHLNKELDNGNIIRMGIEYEKTAWGIGKPVGYYFIKRVPKDWQFATRAFVFEPGVTHDRLPASEIIHYARYIDADSTRPAPWGASVIPKSRHLDQYELAEVVAARTAACKMGWFYSDAIPEGGVPGNVDPRALNASKFKALPGSFEGLPWGVKFQPFDPTHPTANFDAFRKGMLRSWCAGMVGSSYAVTANDYESINFSAGRLDRLSITEMWKLVQRFHIERAARPSFENWLTMSLTTGAIPLPLAKFAKFNKPHFQGRRWQGIDPQKEAAANLQSLLLGITSRSRMCGEMGEDFEDILMEIAEEEMLISEFGLDALSITSLATNGASVWQPAATDDAPSKPKTSKPSKKPVD